MPRYVSAITVAALLAAAGPAARGEGFWSRMKVDYHRMNCWPEPFQQFDRDSTRAPFIVMTNNGWRLQHTLTDYFFDAETQHLNRAGQLKLHWMLTQAPVHRRSVYVYRSVDPEVTAARIASVQEWVSRTYPDGSQVEVMISDAMPFGGSGAYYDALQRQLFTDLPAPQLPPRQDQPVE
jgi:hypothetical protein